MKIAARQWMLGGQTITETFERAAKLGFEGVEVVGLADEDWSELLAAVKSTGVKPALINPAGGHPAMHADAKVRRQWFEAAKVALDRCAETGATGFIVVPTLPNKMSGVPRLPDLWPTMTQVQCEQKVFCDMAHQLGEYAAERGVYVILECLNRYEQFWPLALAEGVAVCQQAETKGIGILADFFHMNIEEADIAASIRAAGDWIVHVHIADSHRRQPGTGHTDFTPGLAALAAIGYDRYLGFEYTVGPDADADLTGALAHIRGILAAVA